jgi:hypothetical protein
MPNYDVRASLTADARGLSSTFRRAGQEARSLGEAIRGTRNMASGMIGQLVGIGTAALGFRAVTQAFKGMVGSGVAFTSELEKTKIGLQAVIAGVENIPWDEAGRKGDVAFKKLRDMAILSPATSQEMFGIFQGIVGPIESAGFSMQKVLDITSDTVLAASALNVDYAQAQRDISMMARGTAGMEVKLFSMLRSTGAIKEDAKEWNAMLPKDRVEKLSAALKKFAGSGKAFGSSWAGVTSTFKDLVDNFKQSALSPVMKVIGRNLEAFNGYLIGHRTEIERFFSTVGKDMGFRLQWVFDRAKEGFTWTLNNWDRIVQKFDDVVAKTKEIAPIIAKAAIAWQGVQLTRGMVGGGIQAGGAMAELVGGAGGIFGGMFAGKAAGAAAAGGGITRAMQFEGITGGFTEAMLAGGAASGGGAGGAAAGMSGLAIAGVAIAGIIAALAVFAGILLTVKEYWKEFTVIFGETGGQLLTMLVGLGKAIWGFLSPLLKNLGSIIMAILVPAWTIFSTALRGLIFILTGIFEALAYVSRGVNEFFKPAFDLVFRVFASLAAFINEWFTGLLAQSEEHRAAVAKIRLQNQEGGSTDPMTDWSRYHLAGPGASKKAVDLNEVPKSAMNVTNDFRGSRISIKQDFKGDGDPDRIVMAMVHDLTRQAESRISSGFAGALTR